MCLKRGGVKTKRRQHHGGAEPRRGVEEPKWLRDPSGCESPEAQEEEWGDTLETSACPDQEDYTDSADVERKPANRSGDRGQGERPKWVGEPGSSRGGVGRHSGDQSLAQAPGKIHRQRRRRMKIRRADPGTGAKGRCGGRPASLRRQTLRLGLLVSALPSRCAGGDPDVNVPAGIIAGVGGRELCRRLRGAGGDVDREASKTTGGKHDGGKSIQSLLLIGFGRFNNIPSYPNIKL